MCGVALQAVPVGADAVALGIRVGSGVSGNLAGVEAGIARHCQHRAGVNVEYHCRADTAIALIAAIQQRVGCHLLQVGVDGQVQIIADGGAVQQGIDLVGEGVVALLPGQPLVIHIFQAEVAEAEGAVVTREVGSVGVRVGALDVAAGYDDAVGDWLARRIVDAPTLGA